MPGVLLLLIICLVIVCMVIQFNSRDTEGFEVFKIKKGKHYSIRSNRPFPIPYKFVKAPQMLKFVAMFGEGCKYDSTLIFDSDINKLCGVSYGLDNHYRSVRIGWRYNKQFECIDLYLYSYVKGKRQVKHLFGVDLYEEVEVLMFHNEIGANVSVSVSSENKSRLCCVEGIDKSWINLMQWPYFGGDKKAPNDMKIFIKIK